MASKICPSCGAKNPSSAYSCEKCAASLIVIPSANSSFPSSIGTKSSGDTTSPYPEPADASENPENENASSSSPTPSPVNYPMSAAGQPLAVVRQSPFSGILNALVTSVFFLVFGFGAGLASIGTLVSIVYLVAVVGIPVVIGYFMRPKYSFYDSYFLKEGRGGVQQINYSMLESVSQARSSIRLRLKPSIQGFRNRPISIPGNPKISNGTDLADWLKSKVPSKQQVSNSEENNPSP